jgi:hypothetical protein
VRPYIQIIHEAGRGASTAFRAEQRERRCMALAPVPSCAVLPATNAIAGTRYRSLNVKCQTSRYHESVRYRRIIRQCRMDSFDPCVPCPALLRLWFRSWRWESLSTKDMMYWPAYSLGRVRIHPSGTAVQSLCVEGRFAQRGVPCGYLAWHQFCVCSASIRRSERL